MLRVMVRPYHTMHRILTDLVDGRLGVVWFRAWAVLQERIQRGRFLSNLVAFDGYLRCGPGKNALKKHFLC